MKVLILIDTEDITTLSGLLINTVNDIQLQTDYNTKPLPNELAGTSSIEGKYNLVKLEEEAYNILKQDYTKFNNI